MIPNIENRTKTKLSRHDSLNGPNSAKSFSSDSKRGKCGEFDDVCHLFQRIYLKSYSKLK